MRPKPENDPYSPKYSDPQPEQSEPKEGVIVKEAVFGLYDNDYLCYHVASAGPANVEFTFDKQTRELISARAVGYYAAPPLRELSDEEIFELAEPFGAFQYGDAQGDKRKDFARAILAAARKTP